MSPDDGLPDKKLSIFDTSKSHDESQVQQPLDQSTVYGNNTLYYLEHNNSQDKSGWLKGFNKQVSGPYKGNLIGNNFDRSILGGLNGTILSGNNTRMNPNRSLLGNSLNITNLNMSKNTNMGLG